MRTLLFGAVEAIRLSFLVNLIAGVLILASVARLIVGVVRFFYDHFPVDVGEYQEDEEERS